VTVNRSY